MNSYGLVIETLEKLPKLVAAKRRGEELSFVAAARQIGISVSTMHRIEVDSTYNIGSRMALRLLRWLAAKPNSLVKGMPVE